MKQELQEELYALAPEWFQRGDLKQSLMAFGFEVRDGWFPLLKDLILALKPIAPDGFEVEQVKEKFGALRFYVSPYEEETARLIQEAEALSEITCEVCGKPGKLGGKGWIQTLCADCRDKE